jgi:hypothetical protein
VIQQTTLLSIASKVLCCWSSWIGNLFSFVVENLGWIILVVVFFGSVCLRLMFFESKKNQLHTFFYELRKTSNIHGLIWVGLVVQMLNSTNGLWVGDWQPISECYYRIINSLFPWINLLWINDM